MYSLFKNRIRNSIFFFISWLAITSVFAQSNRNLLLGIAEKCLNPNIENYCSSCSVPTTDSTCNLKQECRSSLEIWSLNEDFTSFRDIKMCGCSSDFIHGITIPLKPISGVEDPHRPNSIWQFAWNIGITKIPDSELALVVNPKNRRSQDQLHVHMLNAYL